MGTGSGGCLGACEPLCHTHLPPTAHPTQTRQLAVTIMHRHMAGPHCAIPTCTQACNAGTRPAPKLAPAAVRACTHSTHDTGCQPRTSLWPTPDRSLPTHFGLGKSVAASPASPASPSSTASPSSSWYLRRAPPQNRTHFTFWMPGVH